MKTNLFILIVFIVIVSCKKEQFIDDAKKKTVDNEYMTVLGDQLENPFSVENMQKAYDNLKTKSNTPNIIIEPTHLYVRFLPKNEEEFSKLKVDSTLVLYDIPLDYEIEEGGIYYHDPSLADTAITWQYCSVEVDKIFPENIYYEVLSKLFIPEETEQIATKSGLNNFYALLEEESLRITGNDDDEIPSMTKASNWRPSGRIVIDEYYIKNRSLGVQGVEVRARRWFTTHKGYTDKNGYYSCDGTFKRPANYSLKWERYHFSVRHGLSGQAGIDGPKTKGQWNVALDNSHRFDVSKFEAIIFLAAYNYYYGDRQGLASPPTNSFWKPQMKIAAINGNGEEAGNHSQHRRFMGIGNWVKIWKKVNNDNLGNDRLYAATIHELAHAAHWDFVGASTYNNTDKILREAWGAGVGMELTKPIFSQYDYTPFKSGIYTPIVVDMIDGVKDLLYSNGNVKDRVSGYTLKQLHDALKGAHTWEQWRDNIKKQNTNPTSIYLDELFSYWKNL